jgi:hypothetical protein
LAEVLEKTGLNFEKEGLDFEAVSELIAGILHLLFGYPDHEFYPSF